MIAAPGVLANDSDPNSDPLTAIKLTNPTKGTVTLNADGSFTYTPNANANGADSFTYQVSDGSLTSPTATVNLTVTAVNDAPSLVGRSYTIPEDTAIVGNLLDTASDPEGDPLSVVLGNVAGMNGSLVLNPDGTFEYQPHPEFSGLGSFFYRVSDGALQSSLVQVSITVTFVNDPPSAVGDSFGGAEDASIVGNVLLNDIDPENDDLTAALVSGPAHGQLVLNANGSFTYTPNANFFGADSFTYRANDGALDSNTATVSLTVTAVNDQPTNLQLSSATVAENSALGTVVGTLSATDIDGDTLSFAIQGAAGPFAVVGNQLRVNGPIDFETTPTIPLTLIATDSGGLSTTLGVTITVTDVLEGGGNTPPTVQPDAYAVARGRVSVIDATAGAGANDSDLEGPLTFSLLTGPTNGGVVLNPDGSFTFTATPDFVGLDGFTYRATDSGGLSADGVVTLTVEERAETLTGTNAAESIFGYGLDDVINALDGDDKIFTGSGNDIANGGGGNDRIFDEGGDNTLSGDAGNDVIYASGGVDTINGGDGNDTLSGGGGDDTVSGGAGRDKVYGNAGNDTLDGGADNDTAQGGDGNDTISGGDGNDFLYGQGGHDTIDGGAGNDQIFGEAGDDDLSGGAGTDIVRGGSGTNRIDGGAGLDTLFGGADSDTFVLARSFADRDWISGFTSGTDRLEVDGALFGLAPGALDPARLVANANPVATAPGEFLFDTDTGVVRFDADGAGGAAPELIARLVGTTTLAASDFIIV